MASALCGSSPVTLILQSRFRRDQGAEGSEFVDLYQAPYAEARAALCATVAQLNGTTDQLELLEGEYNCVAVPMTPITIENADQANILHSSCKGSSGHSGGPFAAYDSRPCFA